MGVGDYYERIDLPWRPKVGHMRIGSATNTRTAVASFFCGMPAGDTAATLFGGGVERSLVLAASFGSLAFDFVTRCRVSGLPYRLPRDRAKPSLFHQRDWDDHGYF